MNLAPIVLFVYNRPWHTQQTIEALQKNELAKESELFIYSDAAKNEDAGKSVDEVRNYIDSVDGFKKVTVIIREKNWGLANSIIDGVTKIVNEYGKIIVLEDDLVTSPYFLMFMNEALEFYKDEEKVWHISGWNYPIDAEGLEDVFLWRLMNCWGWATWANKWQYFEKDIDKNIKSFTKKDIQNFNLDGFEPYWEQVIANKNKKINSWAVFWYISIFKMDGLCLNPTISFVKNIGLDGSGVHCDKSSKEDFILLSMNTNVIFEKVIGENIQAVDKIKKYLIKFKKNILVRFIVKVKNILRILYEK